MTRQRVVVVGASMAGMRAAEAVYKAGFPGEVLVIGAESHPPYNRPPLSKDALAGTPAATDLAFRVPRAAQAVRWQLGTRVTAADLAGRTVTLDTGGRLDFDALIVASGLRARRLDLPGPAAGRHALRTVDDAIALRSSLTPGTRVVIIGAGFIGCEVAATAVGLGCTVTVVAPEPRAMDRPLGPELGDAMQRRHETRGVTFHMGRLPVAFTGSGRVTGVVLDDGTDLPADVVIEAVGCLPETEWLAGNDLDITDGVLCDDRMLAVGAPFVAACGDIARFPNRRFDEFPRRVEHWTMVTDTARRAGTSIAQLLTTGAPDGIPFEPIPSFWSDQYDLRLQSYGAVALGGEDIRVLEGDLDGDVAVGYHRGGELVGVVLVGLGNRYLYYRELVANRGVPIGE